MWTKYHFANILLQTTFAVIFHPMHQVKSFSSLSTSVYPSDQLNCIFFKKAFCINRFSSLLRVSVHHHDFFLIVLKTIKDEENCRVAGEQGHVNLQQQHQTNLCVYAVKGRLMCLHEPTLCMNYISKCIYRIHRKSSGCFVLLLFAGTVQVHLSTQREESLFTFIL